MLKKGLIVLILLVIGIVISTSCSQPTQTTTTPAQTTTSPPQTTTPLATQTPVTFVFSEQGAEKGARGEGIAWFASEVEKRTGGSVKITVRYNGSLLKGNECLNGVKDGIADIGTVAPAYTPTITPLWAIGTLPGIPDYEKAVSALYNAYDAQRALLDAELTKVNQKLLYIQNVGSYQIVLTKDANSLQDLVGRKVGSASGSYWTILEKLGITPVSIDIGEVYQALSKNTIEGRTVGIDVIQEYKWHEVAPYVFMINFGVMPIPLTNINLDAWKKLTPNTQSIFLTVGKEASAKTIEATRKYETLAKQSLEAAKVKFIYMNSADQAKVLVAAKTIWDAWAKTPEQQQVLGAYRKAIIDQGIALP